MLIVGGTNGKGSVTAMIETALRAAGHRVGALHLAAPGHGSKSASSIDGREVDDAALERAAARVQQAAEAAGRRRRRCRALPTFFECTTAIAFELFRDAQV